MKGLGVGEHELAFWRRHVRIGVSVSLTTLAMVVVYVLMEPPGPQRAPLFALVALAFALSLGVARLPLDKLLRRRSGVTFFALWTGALCLLIFAGTVVAGRGLTGLAFLYFLPVVYGATAYPPAGVVALGGAVAVLSVIGQVLTGGPASETLLLVSTLVSVTVMSSVTAQNHWATFRAQTSLARRLAHLAHHDGLTGCLNHRAFQEALRAAADQAWRHHVPLALLVVDLDEFKQVNDRHGHPRGDAVLTRVGEALRQAAGDHNPVGRIGGDEFAVLLPEAGRGEALAVAERIRAAIGGLGAPVPVTASIGVSTMPEPARDAGDLLSQADQAAYQAKRAGRDFVRVYGEQDRSLERRGVDHSLRRRVLDVLEQGRVTAHYQPVVALADGSVVGYEALARIEDSSLGPAQWLDLAEQAGLRDELEAAMWRAALAAGAPPDGRVLFLNASPEALLSGALHECRALLPQGAAIEVSEHHAIRDYPRLNRDLAEWVEAGWRVAVDDLGAGHANLAHVLNLAPHWLKLDRSLVAGLHEQPSRIALLESLLTFASRIGSRLVAEGVETEAEADALVRVGVRYGQGHLFARPGPAWTPVHWRPPMIDPNARGRIRSQGRS